MGYRARLVHGGNYLLLDSTGRIKLSDFIPPATNEVPQMGGGTAANRTGGSELIGNRATNRDFAFSFIASGSSEAECDRAIREVEQFIKRFAGDKKTPLYLEWSSDNNVAFEPLWGQFGANRRVQIEWGMIIRQPSYLIANLRSRAQKADVRVQIRPLASGKRQRLATAKGAIFEDVIGAAEGLSRGVQVCGALGTGGNEITNPIFGHSTYDNDWNAGGSMVASRNTDKRFVLPGTLNSVKLTSRGASQLFVQSINTGDTNTHAFSCYCKRPDGAAVTSSDVALYYSASLTTTYTSMGDGWYWLRATAAGISSATNVGVVMPTGRTVYMSGYQMEEAAAATPLTWGELIGTAWGGTAHDSATTRTAGYLRLPVAADTYSVAQGTIRIVWKAPEANTMAGDRYLWSGDGVNAYCRYIAADDTFEFSDATNAAVSSAQTFSAGAIYIIHHTWLPGTGLVQYLNGAANGTNATYTPPTAPSFIYIGSDATPANHAYGTIMDFTVYDRAMTAAEVLADYTNITPVTADNQSLSPLPYAWNKDGDGILDNCNDSTRDNFLVCVGIPGSAPAETTLFATTSSAFNSIKAVWLSNLHLTHFRNPADIIYSDLSGVGDANASGGEHEDTTVDTNDTTIDTLVVAASLATEEMLGREFRLITRLADAGANLSIRPRFTIGSNVNGDYKSVGSSATYFLLITEPLVLPDVDRLMRGDMETQPLAGPDAINFTLQAKRSTGSGDVSVDYIGVFFRPYLKISAGDSTDSGYVYWSKTNSSIGAAAGTSPYVYDISTLSLPNAGDVFELMPGQYNIITSFIGDSDGAATITYTQTQRWFVTPRWSLL